MKERPKLLGPREAAGPLRAHTFAGNEVGISILEAARERGDEFGPLSWRHEIAHPMSRGRGRSRRTLFADAVLTYLLLEEKQIAIEQRLVELDRATLSVDRLVSELARYARLYRAHRQKGSLRSAHGRESKTAEARNETRTRDPFLTMEVLYQLSYPGGSRRV